MEGPGAGSSPRGWGTRGVQRIQADHRRFIPTRVGNTRRRRRARRSTSVHPHAGGEHRTAPAGRPAPGGSSPRGWGTLSPGEEADGLPRFIPTRVGNTGGRHARAPRVAVHPHAGGEHRGRRQRGDVDLGSSPRGWGTRCRAASPSVSSRFIPTRVGNTGHRHRTGRPRPVHPHAGGEHARNLITPLRSVGSSPRGWGTPDRAEDDAGTDRFIPTRVGNTGSRLLRREGSSVHPHAGGEHRIDLAGAGYIHGSSPRGWGTRAARSARFARLRFIPTRVGNTWCPLLIKM